MKQIYRIVCPFLFFTLPLIFNNALYAQVDRPLVHFTPSKNWTNDPNGLVYANGEYHIFYQYNPFGINWGHMSWGHAVSFDLAHWKHLPVAIPEDTVMIFSGSCVVDKDNTSGFFTKNGEQNIVAIYTGHQEKKQAQYLAFSTDSGHTFTKYNANPVLDLYKKDFRDPKVFWHNPSSQWVMLVTLPTEYKVLFFGSKNLTQWKQLGEFGNQGNTESIWECPDLFELPIPNQPSRTKWILVVSGANPQKGFVGMQYFVGEFDGKTFTNDHPPSQVLWMDYGKDYYAAISFNNIPEKDGRKIMIGWMNNWAYADKIPATTWRGTMAFPRELSLKKTDFGFRIIQQPVNEIKNLRKEEIMIFKSDIGKIQSNMSAGWFSSDVYEIDIILDMGSASDAGISILSGKSEETLVGYNKISKQMYVDRRSSGRTDFASNFGSIDKAPLEDKKGIVNLHILVDKNLIEVFGNEGISTISSIVFPVEKKHNVHFYQQGGKAKIVSYKRWRLE